MLLSSIFFILIFGIISLFFSNAKNVSFVKSTALFVSSVVLLLSTLIVYFFNKNCFYYQSILTFNFGFELLNLNYSFGFDGLSLFFFLLSSLLIFSCILFIWDDEKFKEYSLNLFLIELFLLIIFSVLDLFLFYIFFEAILIPMYLIIGVWGSRERKIRAAYLFFFYTLCGSILMLIGILYIYKLTGTLNIEYIQLLSWTFSQTEQILLWLAFFIAFSSKIPMFPFHIWLPEAHVEAPTVGSVLLAGILLKLGVYGFLRFSLTLFPEASFFFSPMVYTLSVVGVLYASLSAIRQTDMKRIIAYSSIAHMNLVTLGIFSFNNFGIEGAILQSISHGFVSGGMFLLIGVLYDRYHSRFIHYYGGLVHIMPIYSIFFLIFTLANIALPGTSSFVGEFLLLVGVFKINIVCCIVSALGVVLCGAYSLWLYNRIIFGNLKIDYTVKFSDMSFREFIILFPLLLLIFIVGIYPSFILDFLHLSSSNLSFITGPFSFVE
jgi:proton-translocating NADH-quinone oxidoreductase chain M